MRAATLAEIPELVALMSDFYAESGYELDRQVSRQAFAAILADNRLGYIWFIDDKGEDVGYVVLTLRFGMEYGGLIACLDDLFVLPRSRNRGLSSAALAEVRAFCENAQIRAMTVEVADGEGPAQTVYRRLGMVDVPGRQLLALALATPSHLQRTPPE